MLQLLIKASLDSRDKLKLVKLLVDRGAKINISDKSNLTPYATAVSKKEKAIADFLRSKGARDQVPTEMYEQYYSMYLRMPRL